MKILSIVENAYRGTLEEQDDAAIWFTGALMKAGAPVDVVIRGNAVNYTVKNQDPEGLTIGGVTIEHPAHLDQDLLKLKDAGAVVRVVREDLAERGISLERVLGDFELVDRDQLPKLVAGYDHVFHW